MQPKQPRLFPIVKRNFAQLRYLASRLELLTTEFRSDRSCLLQSYLHFLAEQARLLTVEHTQKMAGQGNAK
jgi:hypothetical protein